MNAEAVLRFQTLREEYGHDVSALEKYEKQDENNKYIRH